MSITRKFLGLNRPPLRLAGDYLIDRYETGKSVDMTDAVVVLPGSQATRRLSEILVQSTEDRSLVFTPPEIVTVGNLPEHFYRPQRPFAKGLVQQLAWAKSLKQADAGTVGKILVAPPGKEDNAQWLELGGMLSALHTELVADALDFEIVAERGTELDDFGERERWEALGEVQQAYLHTLDETGLWDIQTARLEAIKRQEGKTEKDVILVGTVDMTITLRQMIEQVPDQVTALIFAPEKWAERFDEHGCLMPDAWQDAEVPVQTEQVHLADGPAEQADRVARCLADYEGAYRPDDITIGLADEQITPFIQRQLDACGVPSRSAAGMPMAETSPHVLLEAVESCLRNEGYFAFASLVRHPAIHAWIERHKIDDGWLERLDDYAGEHLQASLGQDWPSGDNSSAPVRELWTRVSGLLDPLRGASRPLDQWNGPLRELLMTVYGYRDWDREEHHDKVALSTFEQINSLLAAHTTTIPEPLMPVVGAADALRLTLTQLEKASIPAPVDPAAVELVGWLELPLDDAPALVVCSFNEGYVPSSTGSDVFLPDRLRARLGIQDNRRRYARDAYSLCVLLETRERVDLIVGRKNADGDPLTPSRLLFATDAETTAARALAYFTAPQPIHELPPLAGRLMASREHPDFAIPLPEPLAEPITKLAVTAFRDYLACPYRFYLRHVLRLQTADDSAEELDGAQFGQLVHEVLRQFGEGPCNDSTDAEEIRAFLNEALDKQATSAFGRYAKAVVKIQMEQLRLRLNAFATKQAEWAASGWRIEHSEVPGRGQCDAKLDVDGVPIALRGRIDRIDVNDETGERIIFDYKSSDTGKTPEQTHRRREEWVDLQLPLYRHLAGSLGISGSIRLGYIVLPKDVSRVRFCIADWTNEDLADADEVASEVVRGIRRQVFWPPADPPPDYSEQFAPICQDGVFEKATR